MINIFNKDVLNDNVKMIEMMILAHSPHFHSLICAAERDCFQWKSSETYYTQPVQHQTPYRHSYRLAGGHAVMEHLSAKKQDIFLTSR